MINQLEIIENDLKQLQAEVNKKQPALKETLTQSLISLMGFKNSKDKATPFPTDQLISIFPLVAATKNNKMIIQSLSLLQNMLNYGYIRSNQLLSVVSFLNSLLEIQEDSVHLKVLQMMLICITPKYLDFNDFELIEKILNLIIQMFNSKNVMIQSPASAALFQLSNLIFEQFMKYIKANRAQEVLPGQEKLELSHNFYQRSLKLLRDFISISNGQRPDWSPPTATIPKSIGFDLLNGILKQSSPVLKQSKEAHQIIRKDFIPILMQNFDPKTQDFIGLIRTLKAASRIIVALDDGLELIDQIILLLNRAEHDYEKYLCIEAFHVMCSSPELMVTLNERHSSNASYFTEILNNLVKVCTDIHADVDFNKKKAVPLNPKLFRVLDSNITEFETPQITSLHIYKSSSDCLATITQTLFVLAERNEFNLKTTENTAETPEQKAFIEWLNINWKPLLKVIKSLLNKEVDEVLTQNVLNTFQKLINLYGALKFSQARDSFILAICQACLPTDDKSLKELTLRNIQTTKTVFNIAHCLGAILDVNSWHSILVTLQKTEILFDRIRTQMVAPPSTPSTIKATSPMLQDKTAVQRLINQENESSLGLDLEILASALDSLFSQSSTYPVEHLKKFLEAIHQLSLDYLEKATSPDQLVIEGVNIEGKMKIFGLSRMLDTILVNIDRIEQFWDLVLAHYVCVTTNSKNLVLRNRGVDNLNILTDKLFQHFVNKKEKWTSENQQEKIAENQEESDSAKENEENRRGKAKDSWTKESWQQTLFQPWLEISKTRFADVKENVCGALLKLLQNNGHAIDQNGWKTISLILKEVSQDSTGNAARLGFKCLETAVGDYLQDFDIESVKTLVEVVENFKNVSMDNNISYQSVGMFWKIGDYIAKLQEQEQKKGKAGIEGFEGVWIFILNRLIVDANSDHLELRTSAIHTFANLMIHHGNSLGVELWNKVMSEMIFKLIDELVDSYVHSNAQGNRDDSPMVASPGIKDQSAANANADQGKAAKKWEDTLASLMQNLIKMMKKYLIIIEKTENLNAQSPEIVVLRDTLNKLKGVIMVARNELITESVKFFHEIISAKPEILQFVVDTIFEIFDIVKSFLVEVRQNSKEIKIILNKFIPEILEILREQYDPKRYKILNPNGIPYAKHLFGIVEKMIFYTKQAETYNSIAPTSRIIIEVKPIYDFLESIPSTLCEGNEDMTTQYFNFIINVLSYPVTDKFTDVVVRKIITILDDVISKKIFSDDVYLPYLPKIIEKMRDILCLRSNNEFLVLTNNTLKSSLPIWLYLTDYFHKIIGHFLEAFRDQAKQAIESKTPVSAEIAALHTQYSQQILEIYEKILKEGQKNIGNISKGVFAEIKKDWLEMDMKFISSIATVLVPNFAFINYNLLWRLINILDTTVTIHSKNPAFTQQTTTFSATISPIAKITFEILFKIIDVYQEQLQDMPEPAEEQEKKSNLTKYATQKLIIKCKYILNEYIEDENRSGNMPLPRVRTLEICDILEKLRKLKILPNTFVIINKNTESPHKDSGLNFETEELEEDKYVDFTQPPASFEELSLIRIYPKKNKNESLVQGPKGHLVYLMPRFSEFITCKDADLKVLLKKIFVEISKEII